MKTNNLYLSLFLSIILVGCGNNFERNRPLDVTLLHVNDTLSSLGDREVNFKLGGSEYKAMVGGASRVISALETLDSQGNNVLRLHAGNMITGSSYYTLFEGAADAEVSKMACYDAVGIGSHDFNAGEQALRNYLDMLDRGPCITDYLASNIEFKVKDSPLAKIKTDESVQELALKYIDNEPVGIISLNPAVKTENSSSPNASTKFLNETRTAKKMIKKLHKIGVNKIVILSQLGIEADIQLARELEHVDVIIGAGSHTLMGGYSFLDESEDYAYPLVINNAGGEPVCLGHAWNKYSAVGELSVSWDQQGSVRSCSGNLHVLFDTPHQIRGVDNEFRTLTPVEQETSLKLLGRYSSLIPVTPSQSTESVISRFDDQVERIEARVIAAVSEDLCLERLPGEGRSRICEVDETLKTGSHITPIVAKAFLEAVRTADASIQNSGGVRTDVAKGPFTLGHAQDLLPFNNVVIELRMSGAQIKSVLEEAVDYAISEGGTSGAFPYAAGLRWDLSLGRPFNSRLQNIEINPRLSGEWEPLNPNAQYRIVTNDYIAIGRDGYKTFGEIVEKGLYEDTFIYYTQAFVDYARRHKTLNRLAEEEQPIKSWTN
ncbi:5'-nucleotidase C-terminal domain-containing protein [Reinekea sp. G2M2-21]|uniref:5'-nucleotidase C-terminal domain-containing protein n=1 Tax=Reinekea sp. G2M2-21 TaxID=2788942 RepID=UPI0018AAB015